MTFICYPKCTTCQKAKAWLEENKVSFDERNIKENNPTYNELKELHTKSGLELSKFFNTSGLLYRSMNLKDKLTQMSDEEKLELLSSDGMLVKRPLLVTSDKVFVGFKPKEWESVL